MSKESLLRLDAEFENSSLRSINNDLQNDLEDAEEELARVKSQRAKDSKSTNERIDSLFGYSNMLINNVVTLRKGVLSNSESIIQLEGKANTIEGVLSGVVNNLERNQHIEDEISSFINNMFSVIKDLSMQLSELTGKPFNEEEFNAAFEVESITVERERISPSEMADQNGIPYAYNEALSYLLWEFEHVLKVIENIDFSQSPPIQISGDWKYSEGIISDAKEFKENYLGKISYEIFDNYLSSKMGEDAVLTEKAIISCQKKGTLYGLLFSALKDVSEKVEKNNLENIQHNFN